MSKVEVLAVVHPKEVWNNMGIQERIEFFLDCWNSLSPSMKAYVLSKFLKSDELLLENEIAMRSTLNQL